MSQLGFMTAMKQFFGLHKGQTAMEFGKELGHLSYEEKVEFHQMLMGQGINCAPPMVPTAVAKP